MTDYDYRFELVRGAIYRIRKIMPSNDSSFESTSHSFDVLKAARPYVAALANEDERAAQVLALIDRQIKRACPECGSTGAICPTERMGCFFDFD